MARVYASSIDLSYYINSTERVLKKLNDFSSRFSQGTMWMEQWCGNKKLKKKDYMNLLNKLESDFKLLKMRHSELEEERFAYKAVRGDESFEWLLRAVHESSKNKNSIFDVEQEIENHYNLPIRGAVFTRLVYG
jgi:hypothetical protein